MEEYIKRGYLEDIVDYYLSHSNGAEHYAYGIIRGEVRIAPSADVVPVDNIKFHHILIDNEGTPEVKLQFGEKYMILRGDPVNFREVASGNWVQVTSGEDLYVCSVCNEWQYIPNGMFSYCPHCGAYMRGIENGK